MGGEIVNMEPKVLVWKRDLCQSCCTPAELCEEECLSGAFTYHICRRCGFTYWHLCPECHHFTLTREDSSTISFTERAELLERDGESAYVVFCCQRPGCGRVFRYSLSHQLLDQSHRWVQIAGPPGLDASLRRIEKESTPPPGAAEQRKRTKDARFTI